MIAAVILASGMSKRFGGNKLLMPLGGQSIIEHVIDHAKLSMVDDIFLVYGHHETEFQRIAHDKKVNLIYNKNYHLGQSHAVKKAVETLKKQAEGILFLLGDQPFVTANTIDVLVDRFKEHPKGIIIPTYRGKRGNPVIFSRNFFREIKEIQGDKGPRDIIHKYYDKVVTVPIKDLIENFDIDTVGEYEKALKNLHRYYKD